MKEKRKLIFIDVSGFGHSGKTAVVDYLKQFDSVFGFRNDVEFELFRVPGGLVDLYLSTVESWSQIRSTARIKDFMLLIKRIGTVSSFRKPISFFHASGNGYDQLFKGRFIDISHDFIRNIVLLEKKALWPYDYFAMSPLNLLISKIGVKFFGPKKNSVVFYTNRKTIKQAINEYIQKLFDVVVNDKKDKVLLYNAFEPFNPSTCLKMLDNSLSIVVDRDPRDIYASLINKNDGFIPDFERYKGAQKVKKETIGFASVEEFIFRYKTIHLNVNYINNPRVLRLSFEEFILEHDSCTEKIREFLGVEEDNCEEGKFFDLEKSKKNVGIWKKYKDLPEIKLISRELGDFCYENKK